jgi:peptidoglycan LD-endopeptidase CwlK
MRIEEMIAAVQEALGIEADGKAGPQTWGAIYERLVKKKIDGKKPAEAIDPVDSRSEKHIATLRPEVRPMARAFVHKAALAGIKIIIISGRRSFEEQDAVRAPGVDLGLEWGGNWKNFSDQPHFQLRPAWAEGLRERDMLAQFRSRQAGGTDIYA